MIPRILEDIAQDEIAVITDAEYLDAKWLHPFEEHAQGRRSRAPARST